MKTHFISDLKPFFELLMKDFFFFYFKLLHLLALRLVLGFVRVELALNPSALVFFGLLPSHLWGHRDKRLPPLFFFFLFCFFFSPSRFMRLCEETLASVYRDDSVRVWDLRGAPVCCSRFWTPGSLKCLRRGNSSS